MRFRTSLMAAVAACVLATSGVAMAQVPQPAGGSGEHGVGAGADPNAMQGGAAPGAAPAMAAPMDQGGDAMMAKKPMHKKMMKHKMSKKKMMMKKKMMKKNAM